MMTGKLLLRFCFALLAFACTAHADEPLRLSCTTSHLGCVAKAIGGSRVDVTTIVPFGMCPGHFDLSPRQAAALAEADAILCHGFERFLADVKAAQPDLRTVKVPVDGNWMIPSVQKAGAEALAGLLCEYRPTDAEVFRKNFADYTRAIDKVEQTRMRELARVKGTVVVCSSMNRDLVESYGLRVHAAFPRDEDISAKELAKVAVSARDAGVRLVVDNRQSSGKVGRTLADELGIPLVMFTNFPPETAAANGYIAAYEQNCAVLRKALLAP